VTVLEQHVGRDHEISVSQEQDIDVTWTHAGRQPKPVRDAVSSIVSTRKRHQEMVAIG
jgi:hypothetical protein